MAVSIAAHYPTWRKLLDAYSQCVSVKEKERMLEGVPVSHAHCSMRNIGLLTSVLVDRGEHQRRRYEEDYRQSGEREGLHRAL